MWGTGIEYNQSQDALADDFAELLARHHDVVAHDDGDHGPTDHRMGHHHVHDARRDDRARDDRAAGGVPEFASGDVMALLQIPSIGVETYVVSGVQPADLKQGPGHYPDTPMPGQLGNSAIAGHRTTYGQPFYRLDELQAGDPIDLTTVQGHFTYRVTGSEVVEPEPVRRDRHGRSQRRHADPHDLHARGTRPSSA